MKLKEHLYFGTPTWTLHLITLLCAYYTLERTQFSWIDRPANWWVPDAMWLNPLVWFKMLPVLPFVPVFTPFGVWVYLFVGWLLKLAYHAMKRPALQTHPAAFTVRWLFLPSVFYLTTVLVHYNAYFDYKFTRGLPAMNAAAQQILTTKGPYSNGQIGNFNAKNIAKVGSGFSFFSKIEQGFLGGRHYYGFSYFPHNRIPSDEKFPKLPDPVFSDTYFRRPNHTHLAGPWYIWKEWHSVF